MAGIVSEDIPASPNASLGFGEATENARLQREVASQSGGGNPGQPPPQQAPATPSAPPAPPVQASPQSDDPLNGRGRLDLNQVFPPMPQLNQPLNFRQVLRGLAAHPALPTNSTIAQLADKIRDQKGPLD